MSKQIQILYIEQEREIQNPELELLKRDGFSVYTGITIHEAEQVLQQAEIRVILIDVNMTSDNGARTKWGNNCLALIQNPSYKHILKIIIDIDQDALGRDYKTLKDNSSIIHFHYRSDNRYDELLTILKEIAK